MTTTTLDLTEIASKPYLTIEETAKLLNLKVSHVRACLADGTIPAARFGRLWRINRVRLEAHLDADALATGDPSQRVNA